MTRRADLFFNGCRSRCGTRICAVGERPKGVDDGLFEFEHGVEFLGARELLGAAKTFRKEQASDGRRGSDGCAGERERGVEPIAPRAIFAEQENFFGETVLRKMFRAQGPQGGDERGERGRLRGGGGWAPGFVQRDVDDRLVGGQIGEP